MQFSKSKKCSFQKVKIAVYDCNQDYCHSQYRLQPDYDGNWDTTKYRNNYDWYICSVYIIFTEVFEPILSFQFCWHPAEIWRKKNEKLMSQNTCISKSSSFCLN